MLNHRVRAINSNAVSISPPPFHFEHRVGIRAHMTARQDNMLTVMAGPKCAAEQSVGSAGPSGRKPLKSVYKENYHEHSQ